MGAASGGRLTFSLVALAVIMASGATGVVVIGAGPGHSSGGGKTTTTMVGSSDQRSDTGRTGPATAGSASAASPSGSGRDAGLADGAQAGSASGTGDRYNVGAAHSPALLQQLAGPLSRTGVPSGTLAEGVDVAADQHPGGAAIDWSQVAAAGYTFAAVKTTEGDYYANPWYATDTAGAVAAGLTVTGYHFAIPNQSGGATQADFAVSHLGDAAGGRAPALTVDLEYDPYTATDHTNQCYGMSAPALVAWIGAFTSEARRFTGHTPVIYTTAAWWSACTGDSDAFSAASLWVAGYGSNVPVRPAAWRSWAFWQYTSVAAVPGIAASGSTDVSYLAATSRSSAGQPGPFTPAVRSTAPVPALAASPAATPSASDSGSAVTPDAASPSASAG